MQNFIINTHLGMIRNCKRHIYSEVEDINDYDNNKIWYFDYCEVLKIKVSFMLL